MSISLIAAVAKNNAIGKKNGLLWDIPVDMKHFRETTSGHPIIMGKRTFESIGRVLPNRRNIVITRDPAFAFQGVEVFHSLEEALALFQNTQEEAFVIGGGEIYAQALSSADRLYITRVHENFEGDVFFPEISPIEWEEVERKDIEVSEGTSYPLSFIIYTRTKQTV